MKVSEAVAKLSQFDDEDEVYLTLDGEAPSRVVSIDNDGVDKVYIDTDGEVEL